MIHLVLWLRIWLLAAIGSTPWTAQAEPRLDEAVDAFVQIVERSEYGEKSVGVARWGRPIRIAVTGRGTPDQLAALEAHIAELSRRSGLAVELVAPIARSEPVPVQPLALDLMDPAALFQLMYHLPGNGWALYLLHGSGDTVTVSRGDLLVMFADQANVAQIARILRVEAGVLRALVAGSMPCFATFFIDPANHEFRYAMLILRTDVAAHTRRRCLHEELTQVMGLRNDVRGSEITLFDDMPSKRRTELTPLDWLFLEVLYDKRLKPGTKGAELRRVARELIGERWPPR